MEFPSLNNLGTLFFIAKGMRIAINTRFLLKDKIEGMGLFTHEVLKRLVSQHPEDEFIFFFDRPYDPQFVYGKNVKPLVLFPLPGILFYFFGGLNGRWQGH